MSKQTDRLCKKVNSIAERAASLMSDYKSNIQNLGSKEWRSLEKAQRVFIVLRHDTRHAPTKRQVESLLKKCEAVDIRIIYAVNDVLNISKHDKLLTEIETLWQQTSRGMSVPWLQLLFDSVCVDEENERKQRKINTKAKVLAEAVTEEQFDDNHDTDEE